MGHWRQGGGKLKLKINEVVKTNEKKKKTILLYSKKLSKLLSRYESVSFTLIHHSM